MFTLTVQKCYHPGMEITEAQYERIAPVLPVQRGNVTAELRCSTDPVCRRAGLQVAMPPRFGNWHTVYTRRLVEEWGARGCLNGEQIVRIKLEAVSWTAPSSRSPRRHGCAKKNGPQSIGKSRGGWTTKIHMVAADARTAITFSLSPGQAHDAPEGRKLLTRLGPQCPGPFLLMDRAYEGNETRQLALALGYMPVVPPLSTRVHPWVYDREMYKRRNEVERLFRRLKGFRRIFSRFEKLDVLFLGFISFALILDALR